MKTYDETLGVLRHSLDVAKLGNSGKADGLRRLDKLVRNVEKFNARPWRILTKRSDTKGISQPRWVGGRCLTIDRAIRN